MKYFKIEFVKYLRTNNILLNEKEEERLFKHVEKKINVGNAVTMFFFHKLLATYVWLSCHI